MIKTSHHEKQRWLEEVAYGHPTASSPGGLCIPDLSQRYLERAFWMVLSLSGDEEMDRICTNCCFGFGSLASAFNCRILLGTSFVLGTAPGAWKQHWMRQVQPLSSQSVKSRRGAQCKSNTCTGAEFIVSCEMLWRRARREFRFRWVRVGGQEECPREMKWKLKSSEWKRYLGKEAREGCIRQRECMCKGPEAQWNLILRVQCSVRSRRIWLEWARF